jgi:hypothetical protein
VKKEFNSVDFILQSKYIDRAAALIDEVIAMSRGKRNGSQRQLISVF